MFCNRCGKELKEGTSFCPACGKEIKIMPHSTQQKQPVQKKQETESSYAVESGKSRLPIILASVCAAVLVIALSVVFIIIKPWKGKTEATDDTYDVAEISDEEVKEEETSEKEVKDAESESGSTEDIADVSELSDTEDEENIIEAEQIAEEPVAGEDDTERSEENKDEMYKEISDLFGERTVYDGSTYVGLDRYEGDPSKPFYISGDYAASFKYITNFTDNTVTLDDGTEKLQIRYVNPWMIEFLNQNGESNRILTGDIASISAAMSSQDVPEYIFPESDHTKINMESNIMSYSIVRIAKNEIYARHGRKFKDPELKAYFEARSWYNGTIEPDKFKDSVFNAVEKENITNFKWWEDFLLEENETR